MVTSLTVTANVTDEMLRLVFVVLFLSSAISIISIPQHNNPVLLNEIKRFRAEGKVFHQLLKPDS